MKIRMYTAEYIVGIVGSVPKSFEISNGISNNWPHDRNWQKTTTILDPIAVPIPLSSAKLTNNSTMAVYGVQVETDSYHKDAHYYCYDYAYEIHVFSFVLLLWYSYWLLFF